MNTKPLSPRRGDVWLVNLDPTIGMEMKKTRPALVISSDAVGKLAIKLIVPITDKTILPEISGMCASTRTRKTAF